MAFTTEKLHPGTRRLPWQIVISLVDGYVYTRIMTAARPPLSPFALFVIWPANVDAALRLPATSSPASGAIAL